MDTRTMMAVKDVFENESKVVIKTTGARYVFNKDEPSGSIDCYQLLNGERHVARIDFAGLSFTNTTVQKKDDSTCLLSIVPIRGNYNAIPVNETFVRVMSMVSRRCYAKFARVWLPNARLGHCLACTSLSSSNFWVKMPLNCAKQVGAGIHSRVLALDPM